MGLLPKACAHPVKFQISMQIGPESLPEQLEALLADSRASMNCEGERETKAQKAAWWRRRLSLDERMRGLLERMQACLGPWM
jgi:hypothetical protein